MEEQKQHLTAPDHIQSREAELRQLRRELAEANSTAAAKEKENAELLRQNEELTRKLAERFVEICNRDSGLRGLEREKAELLRQNEDLTQKLAERFIEICNRDSGIRGLEREKAELVEKLAERFVEICNRDSGLRGLEKEKAELLRQNEELTSEKGKLLERVAERFVEICNRDSGLRGLEKENKELLRQNEKLAAENKELIEKLAERFIEICNRDSGLRGLSKLLAAERDKSVYLYHEREKLKSSLVYKVTEFLSPGRLFRPLLRFGAENLYWAGHLLFKVLPCTWSTRMRVRDKVYPFFGSLLDNVESYRTWQLHHDRLEALRIKGETGLIMPREIPLTSIIIPVYNNIELTRRCLHSIYSIGSSSPFEVLIVDDFSSDDYRTLIWDFPEVRVIRNHKNLGFLLTANRGASEAKGEYIIFLNNDTEVVSGWLDELTAALYDHPEAGMIGSQLVHLHTGTLQESGNLICLNGEMLPLGRGEDPDHPRYTCFREVDFCSAASIIMRRKVFEEMKGFDTVYAPAYFEDPDLGLRLKKSGYKNYVYPLSRVLHQEMASYGDSLAKGRKNRAFFFKRWHKYLKENSLYKSRTDFFEHVKYPRPRIMYIDAETPMADRGSGGMDAVFFMEYMIKRGYEVVFHGEYTPGYAEKYTPILLRMGVECIYEPQCKIWEYLAAEGKSFSYIFVSRIYQARTFDRLLKSYAPQAAYIFDTVDVHFVREQLEANLKKDKKLQKLAAETKKYELAVAEAADATIVISSDEKKLLEDRYGLTNIYHIPQARELHGLAPNPNRQGAVFIGSAHPPNMDGLRYFHDEILPLLPREFKLTIIGEALRKVMGESREYKDLLKCPQFNFVGFVEDLGTELDKALITIAPLRYGAGTKGKVASSMSYGVPCVSSSFGTEGTGMKHGENILIAGTPEEFAESIMKLFKDQELWKKISDGGIKFIRDNYAPETVEKMMDKLFADVDKKHRENKSRWAAAPVVPKLDEE